LARDTQIGAIAREYELTIATRNARHFPFCKTENPFAPTAPAE
jgi:predicted nucleic acid-binding protein